MTPPKIKLVDSVKAINWNRIEGEEDLEVWDCPTGSFQLPEKIPPSNDIPSQSTPKPHEQQIIIRVSTGLALLDIVQGAVGIVSLIPDAVTPHEEAILTNIAFMGSVCAKSYSSIFSILIPTEETDETFRWSEENEYLQKKAKIILDYHRGRDAERHKVVSTILESLLFYLGFYAPVYWSAHTELTNTADLIRLIIRNEAVHGYCIDHKYQGALVKASQERRDELQKYTYNLMVDLCDNEEPYTESLYDEMGLAGNAKMSLRHNTNKTLNNLGYEVLFEPDQTAVNPPILAAPPSSADENHDLFSGSGSSYVIGAAEATTDDDWDF